MAKVSSPLLKIGRFGTHLISCSNIYSFTGEVPATIKQGGYKSEQEGIEAFAAWFKAQDLDFKREHVGNLRYDVYELVLTTV